MAILVCYSESVHDHTKEKALYLDQLFYDLIFRQCRPPEAGYPILRLIALLRYKSPTVLVVDDELADLAAELKRLGVTKTHPQIADLIDASLEARESGRGLTISGDMYSEVNGVELGPAVQLAIGVSAVVTSIFTAAVIWLVNASK